MGVLQSIEVTINYKIITSEYTQLPIVLIQLFHHDLRMVQVADQVIKCNFYHKSQICDDTIQKYFERSSY